ncbi:MAG: exodeoxyribonuclease III, partial [Chromatiales bacterium]|nr:exodeoxyribonuclease III [Chromatiales bacterium]
MMKIVSFNTNGIRARPHQLQALKDQYDPDIIGIQETKVQDPDFPIEMVDELGYQTHFHGQKTHYGVALLSKTKPVSVQKGYPNDTEDAQRRMICGQFEMTNGEPLTVINGYFPQGENRDHEVKFPAKQKFYADLMDFLEAHFTPSDNLLVIGDMNIAPQDADVGIGADNAKRWLRTGKCSFLPEEREWMEHLTAWGLTDTFRQQHADVDDRFSWFDYRSRG